MAMIRAAQVGVTTRVTRRGLEITVPRPYVVQGCLAPLLLLLLVLAPALWIVGRTLDVATWEWLGAAGDAVGVGWLVVALAGAALTLGFARYGNDHYVFGRRALRNQGRVGRVVISDDDLPFSRLGEIEVVADPTEPGRWCVRAASIRVRAWPALLISSLQRDDAERVADLVRRWLRAPGELPVDADHEVSTPALVAEAALAVATSRIVLAVPFLIGVTALLTLGVGWQLREAQHGRGEPLPRLDGVADGELRAHRWVLHAPWDPRDAEWPHRWTVGLELAIEYTPDDGRTRTLWLRTRRGWRDPLDEFGAGPLRWATKLLGPPAHEFAIPGSSGATIQAGASWADLRDAADGPHRWDEGYRAARLLSRLDDPFALLLAAWTAPPADWRVAYSTVDPDRAMPLRWAEAERAAMAHASLKALMPAAGVAVLLAFATLPRFVARSRSRRWLGRLAVLGAVVTVPWWAGHGERLAAALGAGDWAADLGADVLRLGVPVSHLEHVWLTRSPPRDRPATELTLRWAPEQSASAPLLGLLGLLEPPPHRPVADSAAAVDLMRRRAAASLAALDDAQLADFVDRHRGAGGEPRTDPLHRAVVLPAVCAAVAERTATVPLAPLEALGELCTRSLRSSDPAPTRNAP